MADLIFWSDRYSLGVEVIDEQHKKMIGIINKLYHAMQASTEKADLPAIIQELVEYADYHFTTEEKYFDEFHYDDTIEHKKSHEMYREKIAGFLEEHNKNTTLLPFEMMDFLGDWWTGHILGADRKYVQNFHEHGLK